MATPPEIIPSASQAEVPPLSADATPEEKDAHWFKHVYQGDRMPQLTVRSVLLGGFLGMVMCGAQLYTSLSIGWGFGITITACVISYVFWSLIHVLSGRSISQMSILENNCMASTASAAGYSTGSTIATMFGALLLLNAPEAGKTSKDVVTYVVQPWYIVGAFTLLTGLMGVFLAIPMKRQMINHEQLAFPSGIATAETLRALYSKSREAMHKAWAMLSGLGTGLIVGILNTGEGTLKFLDDAIEWVKHHVWLNVRLPEQVPAAGFYQINGKSLIGFGFEPSLLLIGAGMITGLRVSLSMLAGSALLYFVIGPMLINMDAANAGTAGYKPSIELVGGGRIFHLFRWGLWGGTAVMVFSSLTVLALQWKTIARAFTGALGGRKSSAEHADAMERIEVPVWWMVAGMLPVAIGMVAIQMVAWSISWYAGIIAVAMSFILSLVASRATGETDTTPIGAMGKVMQLLFAGLAPGNVGANLASAGIAANSAASSADLLTDLKSGYLLGANPRKQFLAQFFGVFFGTIAIVPVWYLMIPHRAALEAYPAPSTNMWFRVAQVLTQGVASLPESAKVALLIGAMVGIALPLIERYLVPADKRKYFPSAMGLGLAWVVPFANALSFAIGATIVWIWEKMNRKSCEAFSIPLAAGFVAGESMIKAIIAMTATIIGLSTR